MAFKIAESRAARQPHVIYPFQYGNLNGPAGKLARLLREYGICSKTLSFTGEPDSKGYLEEVFMDAWERYL